MPLADVDLVIVSHHAFATQVVHATRAPVLAYVHSPARWAWNADFRSGEAGGRLGAVALTALAARTRRDERAAAPRLAGIIANSTSVAHRIKEWWGLKADIVHPPVDTEYYTPDPAVPREPFFLLAGRLVPYKRPELAVRAAREAGVHLVVAGDGRYLAKCRSEAGPRTEFLGRVDDATMRDLHRRSQGLLMPGIEDFGIVPVEAMACGTPVLALGEGGALDTVLPGLSGSLIEPGSDDDIVAGFVQKMRSHDFSSFDAPSIRRHAESFSRRQFRESMRARAADVVERHAVKRA
jgi:glycosyltransferase involved in cell wall biosynthesis